LRLTTFVKEFYDDDDDDDECYNGYYFMTYFRVPISAALCLE